MGIWLLCEIFANILSTSKDYSAANGIDGTIGLFWRTSGCSTEQKTLRIPFRTVPQRSKMLRILYHGTKIEANSRNSVLNHSTEQKTLEIPNRSAEEKNVQKSVLWKKSRSKISEFRFFEACLGQRHAVYSVCWSRIFCKTNFFSCHFYFFPCHFLLFRALELTLP
jgi:hypothetical protein